MCLPSCFNTDIPLLFRDTLPLLELTHATQRHFNGHTNQRANLHPSCPPGHTVDPPTPDHRTCFHRHILPQIQMTKLTTSHRGAFATTDNCACPQAAATMSQPWSQYHDAGTALMPPPHSYEAPYYSGQVGNPIEDFLREYEELTDGCNLTEQQKVEKITHYICPELRYLWKSHNGYQACN